MRTNLLGIALLSAAMATSAQGQTLEEVRLAVDSCVGIGEQAKVARANLTRWGNEALPYLRELAGKSEDATLLDLLSPMGHGGAQLVAAVKYVDTPEAVEFLVEILDRKTLIAPHYVLMLIQTSIGNHREQMQSHVRLKQLVFKFAKDGDGMLSDLAREKAAELMADLGWDDGVPLLELLLKDDDLDVRMAAAEAIEILTGQDVELPKPGLSFPATDLSEVLVRVASIDGHHLRGHVVPWFDGRPALVTGSGPFLESTGLDGSVRARENVGLDALDVGTLSLPDRSLRWILLADEANTGFHAEPGFAVCLDWERHELWRFAPARPGIGSMCRLYDESGCTGVAFGVGGDEGVVAFDPDGHELFRVPRTYVTWGLASHPRLPGLWLRCGGILDLYDTRGRKTASNGGWPDVSPFLYASDAVLVPAADGTPAIVAAGNAGHSIPIVARLDAEMHEAWRATVPDRLTALALLDPGDRAPLLAATTGAGDLLIFDLDGVLRQRSELSQIAGSSGARHDVAVYSISAGRLPDGRYGLAVGMLTSTQVYAMP